MVMKSKLLLLGISLVMFVLNVTSLPKHLRGFAVKTTSPITKPINKMYLITVQKISSYGKSEILIKENLLLQTHTKALETKLLILSEQQENYNIKNELSQYFGFDSKVVLPAYIVKNYSIKGDNYLTLDKGSRSGVQVGDNVLFERQILGIVQNLTSDSSTVLLVNSSELEVPSKAIGTNTFGIFSCSNKVCKFEKVVTEDPLNVGDIIVTSGNGGKYLSSLLLGSVVAVNSDPTNIFKSADLNFKLDTLRLNKVVIILNNE